MSRSVVRAILAVGAGIASSLAVCAPAVAGAPGHWTKITLTDSGFNDAGMLRTADGVLHLVWRERLKNGSWSYHWGTISRAGRLTGSGTVVSGWNTLENDPRLVPDGSQVRLVFIGGQDTNPGNFFSIGAVYTETSAHGTSWTLVHGSLAQHTTLNLGLAAVTQADHSTPVVAFGLNNILYFHQGVDPDAPAAGADGTAATGPVATGLFGAALARAKDGSISVAWFDQGYRARQILPSAGPAVKAPFSGGASGPDNEPRQQVAFAARNGGGLFLAYCVPASGKQCAHIDLWRVGSKRPLVVPGSGTGNAGRVALAAAPGGRLWVSWYDFGANRIHAVRTNPAASGFGPVHTVKPPPGTFIFNRLQAEGSSQGRLDIIVNVLLSKAPNPIELWHTQIAAP